MNPTNPTVLVLGASGNVGSALTLYLVHAGVRVHAFYDPSTGQAPRFPLQAAQIHGDFDDRTALDGAMTGVDAVFMLTPPSPSQVRWQRSIVAAAVENDVRKIVKLSAFDTGPDSILQMGRWHYDGEVAVAASGRAHVFVRPQYFLQMLTGAVTAALRTGELSDVARGTLRLGAVDVADIAAVAAAALTTSTYDGQVLVPTGPTAPSFLEMADELSGLVGRPVRYVERPVAEVRAELAARGWPAWHVDDYLKIHGESASPLVTSCVADVTGRTPTSFTTYLRSTVERAGEAF